MKKALRLIILLSFVIFSSCLFVACGLVNTGDNEEGAKTFSSIEFNNKTLDYDGEEHTIVATGAPNSATITYTNDGPFKEPGVYQIGVTIKADGYNDYTKTATLTIKALEFKNVTFNDKTLDYDGEEHTIVATGIPSNATAVYSNKGPYVNAGEYTINLKITATGYKTYNKSVKLKINKINFPSDITFESKKVMYTGNEKTITITGDLPEGTQVNYINNKATQVGQYNATATLTNPNYNTKTLNATLTIYNLVNEAKNTIDTLLSRPDAWSFMPEGFKKENMAYETNPAKNFSSFVNVNNINKKFMGKQMYVLWEGVEGMESLLSKFDVVYAVGETIASAYQNFINSNSDDYSEWNAEVAGFKVKIVLDGKRSTMLIGNNVFAIELFADSDNNINRGRIEIAEGGILNYEMQDDYLKFNVSLSIKGVMAMKQIEFVRNEDGEVAGYFYEYMGAKSVAVKTSAVIVFDDDYAVVMSAKRESDDLLIDGYEEVYSSTTGEFIAAEVLENNKLTKFDTFWVNLYNVSNVSSVKMVSNGSDLPNENKHDVYLNGSTNEFVPVKNKIAFVETSRKFDIEMKTVYYLQETTEGDKVIYEVVETEIPMLFVQKGNVEDFSSDIVGANKNTFVNTPLLPTTKINVAGAYFEDVQITLNGIKELLTFDELVSQLGTKNSFFNN